jgi:hypothetical protein
MAAQDALDAQPSAFEDAVFEDGFHHILTAGWRIAAGWRGKRRDEDTVKINGDKENFSCESLPFVIGYL